MVFPKLYILKDRGSSLSSFCQFRVLLEQGRKSDIVIDNPFPMLCSWVVCVRALPLVTLLPVHLQKLAVMTWPATQTFNG